jgi:hypothetical protein
MGDRSLDIECYLILCFQKIQHIGEESPKIQIDIC